MARLQEFYRDNVTQELVKQFGYKSIMQVPRIEKITLNMGVGEGVADRKHIENAVDDLTKIAGQKAVVTTARKAIAGFKIREEYPIGCKVTLRGRSEEHTSELQSRGHLVCRLLLEKKKVRTTSRPKTLTDHTS